MAKKRKKRRGKARATAAATPPVPAFPVDLRPVERPVEIVELLRSGREREALARARAAHEEQGTAASAALLVDVYGARIEALLARGLWTEADALFALVCQRHPGADARLVEIEAARAIGEDRLERLAPWLADPERRTRVEAALRRHLDDPGRLVRCAALPDDEPLRVEARAIAAAFEAVTGGPVDDAQLALPAIARRSPLAPWKLLLRAIAAFHRHDDAAVRAALARIDPDSAPGRLVPVLVALIEGGEPPAWAAPLTRALRATGELPAALEAVDARIADPRAVVEEVTAAMGYAIRVASREAPERVESLCQELTVRAWRDQLPIGQAQAAMGCSPPKDAAFWRLMARAEEGGGDDRAVAAVRFWEEFRWHALRQGWFEADGPEEATVLRHMAGLVATVDPAGLARPDPLSVFYSDQPRELRRTEWPPLATLCDAGVLHRRACQLDPDAEGFRAWFDWTRRVGASDAERDAVARAWSAAHPEDARPLVALAQSNAPDAREVLDYLDRARALDPMTPGLERTRRHVVWRLIISQLAAGETEQARGSLPLLADLALPAACLDALETAVRWVALRLEEAQGMAELRTALGVRLGDEYAAGALLLGVAETVGVDPEVALLGPGDEAAALRAIATAWSLAEPVGQLIPLPVFLMGPVKCAVLGGTPADGATWRRVAQAALAAAQPVLSFDATVRALADPSEDVARLLLLRAQCLPPVDSLRRSRCLAAAAQLALRRQDHRLAGLAWAVARQGPSRHLEHDMEIQVDELDDVLRLERAAVEYVLELYESSGLWEDGGCDCAVCLGEAEGPEAAEDDVVGIDPLRLDEVLARAARSASGRRR